MKGLAHEANVELPSTGHTKTIPSYHTLNMLFPLCTGESDTPGHDTIQSNGKKFTLTPLPPSPGTSGSPKLSIQLASYNKEGKICLHKDAINQLEQIKKPVAVLTICGPYRTGKSYYVSRFLGDIKTFKTSNKRDACTFGIWMATRVLECEEFVVIVLDTEGLDNPEISKSEDDVMNFIVLSSLISSFLVYNTKGTEHYHIEKMR